MHRIKKIGLSLAVVSILGIGFVGCGGGGSSSPTENTESSTNDTSTQTGYLIDSGIEGLRYVGSLGTTGETKENGKYEFKKDETVKFYLGNVQIGSEVTGSSEPITVVELFGESEDTYNSNLNAVNFMRLIQTADDDSYHDNGIKLSDDVKTLFNSKTNFDFSSELELKTVSSQLNKDLVSTTQAIDNFKYSLDSIASGIVIPNSEKAKTFNRYSNTYFSVKNSNTKIAFESDLDLVQVYTDVTSDVVSVLSAGKLTEALAVVIENGAKSAVKALTNSNILSEEAKVLVTAIVTTLKAGNGEIDVADLATLGISQVSVLANLSTDEEKIERFNYILSTVSTGINLTIKGLKIANFAGTTVDTLGKILEIDTHNSYQKLSADLDVAQKYLQIYYNNAEDSGKISEFLKEKLKVDQITISNSTLESQTTTGEGSTISTSLDDQVINLNANMSQEDILKVVAYDNGIALNTFTISDVQVIINEFKDMFEPYYTNYQKAQNNINDIITNEAPIAKAGDDKTVTYGDTVYFDASSSNDDTGIASYVWKENNSVLSNSSTFAKSDLSEGTHTITLTVTDNDGATATDTIIIKVNENITYSWQTSSWSSCTGDCGTNNGTQTRTVTCEDSNGNSSSDDMCTDTKPSLTQSCTASECEDEPTNNNFTYSTITSSVTGKIWMDRNLGASRACTSFDDTQCYGDYYQWGRNTDGHEKSDSSTTSTQATSTSNVNNGGKFITSSSSYSYDWAKNADSDGTTRSANWNPCPTGYRIPTIEELEAENISDRSDAYSKLMLPSAGYRH
ncbi:MAG: PKD domain-containing protein, partial [Campylobacterota bacterium]|nr:PKD domain-containing protein [Campylobacterota bacterium]